MKKLLPYNFDNGLDTECGNFYKMAIVGAYERFSPWVIERFIRIQMYEDFIIGYYNIYGTEHQTYYDEVLEQREILKKENIISTIIDEVNSGGYVMIRTDRYFVPGGEEYHEKHHNHPMMILGYDDGLNEFYATDVGIDEMRWGLHTFKFSVVEEAYYSGLDIMRKDFNNAFGPLEITTGCVFYPKNFGRSLKLKYIYDNVCMMLKGGEVVNKTPSAESIAKENVVPIKGLGTTRRLGLSIYKAYYEDLHQLLLSGFRNDDFFGRSFGVYHGLEIIRQNKQGLLYRLNYLIANGYMDHDAAIPENAEKLVSLVDMARNILGKFYFSNDVTLLDKARNIFLEAEATERDVLERSRELIAQSLIRNL